jgi:hypothetical protein
VPDRFRAIFRWSHRWSQTLRQPHMPPLLPTTPKIHRKVTNHGNRVAVLYKVARSPEGSHFTPP